MFTTACQPQDNTAIIPKEPSENNQATFTGTVSSGEQINRDYCEEGLYLSHNDQYLLIREASPDSEAPHSMVSDTTLISETVEITGIYPAQEAFCMALMCDCEDYILADSITTL